LDGSLNANPYFWTGDLPELDKWYLLIGYIHGSGDPSTISHGGIYDGETGEKISGTSPFIMKDYKNNGTATTQRQRTYFSYACGNCAEDYDWSTAAQYFWNPTFVEVDNYDLPMGLPWY
jgi:hypothetical protein|tara:strand:+ start:178 stop:534 length:357 start_codon:yes stop_codon:yes gene_type:complete